MFRLAVPQPSSALQDRHFDDISTGSFEPGGCVGGGLEEHDEDDLSARMNFLQYA